MFPSDDLLFLAPEPSEPKSAQGNFARSVYILALEEPQATGNRAFLSKVLSAVQLDLDKDTLFAEIQDSEAFSFVDALKNKQPACVLVFGLPPSRLGLAIEATLYQPFMFYNINWLFADALSILEPDKNKKSQLWQALKQMFL